jgi:2-polyprenyl-3-methyl-5-hydroxy-6-metoxy-1,4-benzoquinol methylase
MDLKNTWYKNQIEYYKKSADEQERGSPYFDFMFDYFIKVLNAGKGDKILEIGCNDGRFTIPLLHKSYRITAIDIAEEPLLLLAEKAKEENVAERLNLAQANIEEYETSEKFDVIFCTGVLHHLYDLNNVASRIYEHLRENGRFVCLEPNPLNILWYIHIFLVELQKGAKWNVEKRIIKCSKRNLKKVFYKNNFSQVNIYPLLFFPPQIINKVTSLKRLEPAFSNAFIINKFLAFNILEAVK